jgi:hypothetical protein
MEASDALARRSRGVITLLVRMAGGGNGGEMSGMGPFGRWLDWSQGWIVHDGGFFAVHANWEDAGKRTGHAAR